MPTPKPPKPRTSYAGAVKRQAARTTPAQRAASTAAIGRQLSARYGPNSVTRGSRQSNACYSGRARSRSRRQSNARSTPDTQEVTEIRDPKGKRVQDRRTPAQKQADRLVQQGLAPSTNAPKLRARAVGKQARAALPPYASKAQAQAARTKRAQAMPPYVNPGVTRAAGRAATKQRMGSIPPYANPAVAAAVTRKRTNAMPPYASPAQHKLGGGRITGSSKKGKK